MPIKLYDEDQVIFQRAIRKFLAKEVVPYVEEWDEKHEIPCELWKKFGDQGYLCTSISEEYGGGGGYVKSFV